MNPFSELTKKESTSQLVLTIVFLIYLIMGYKMPDMIAEMIDNVYGKIIVALIAILVFSYSNPIVGVLGCIVAFELIRRSSISTGSDALQKYVPSEKDKKNNLTAMNQFPYTLEQEVVSKMAPPKVSPGGSQGSFSPVLDDLYDAAPIDYKGVV
tara:strand:- start:2553 stop:3014 length:462 start_codon:yes stop_codon:yes gene_type:complete